MITPHKRATDYTADEEAIRDLFGQLLDDWGRGDGDAYGSRFTEDAARDSLAGSRA